MKKLDQKYKDKKWLENQYITLKKSTTKIAKECNVQYSNIEYFMRKFDISRRKSWKKERKFDRGYVIILKSEHPRANRFGYIREHIFIMEQFLGRYITVDEHIHHIDEIKQNNEINNLYLCKNASEHTKIHHQMRELLSECYRLAIPCKIDFNKEKGLYFIV